MQVNGRGGEQFLLTEHRIPTKTTANHGPQANIQPAARETYSQPIWHRGMLVGSCV